MDTGKALQDQNLTGCTEWFTQHPEHCSVRMSAQLQGRKSTQFHSWLKTTGQIHAGGPTEETKLPPPCSKITQATDTSPVRYCILDAVRRPERGPLQRDFTPFLWGIHLGASFSPHLMLRQQLRDICKTACRGRTDDESQKAP